MATMYCPKCIVEIMDLIDHEEGDDFEILHEWTENEVREDYQYTLDTYKCPECGFEVEDYMEDDDEE